MNKKARKIMHATITLFSQEGIEHITMDQIASNANSSKATVYKYYSDKDGLYYAICKYLLDTKANQYMEILSEDSSLHEKFMHYIDAVSDFVNSGHFEICKVLTNYTLDSYSLFNHYQETYQNSLRTLIADGIHDKILKSDLGIETIYTYLDMSITYYQNNKQYREKMNHDMHFQENMMSFLLSNIFINK